MLKNQRFFRDETKTKFPHVKTFLMKKSDLTGSFFMISSKSRVVRFQVNLILGKLCYKMKKREFKNSSVLLYFGIVIVFE